MKSFKLYIEQEIFVEQIINEFDNSKTWSMKKDDILTTWKNIRPNMPIFINPISDNPIKPDNKTFGEDGIRISGSWQFIMSTLGKLKQLLVFENPDTRLRLVFKGVDKKRVMPGKQSFVFYVNLEKRKRKKKGII